MAPPLATHFWSPAACALLVMVRIIGYINGQDAPSVTLGVDTVGDLVTARHKLVVEAAEALGIELLVPFDDVTIYLPGGTALSAIAHVEKDDKLYFGFGGEPWREPQAASRLRTSLHHRRTIRLRHRAAWCGCC